LLQISAKQKKWNFVSTKQETREILFRIISRKTKKNHDVRISAKQKVNQIFFLWNRNRRNSISKHFAQQKGTGSFVPNQGETKIRQQEVRDEMQYSSMHYLLISLVSLNCTIRIFHLVLQKRDFLKQRISQNQQFLSWYNGIYIDAISRNVREREFR
jgi:hypothetical protein